MLTNQEKTLLKELKHTEFSKPLFKLFDECFRVLQDDLLKYTVETEEQVFNLVRKKSQIDGASKLLALVKSQLEKTPISKLSNE
jgi:hypothetical protein